MTERPNAADRQYFFTSERAVRHMRDAAVRLREQADKLDKQAEALEDHGSTFAAKHGIE